MGMVHAIQKGDLSPAHVGSKVRDAAKKMKPQDAKDFAATKTKDLPEHVEKKAETTHAQPSQPPTAAQPSQPPSPATPATPSTEPTKQASDLRIAEDMLDAAERALAESFWQVKRASRMIEQFRQTGVQDEELAKRANAVDTVVNGSSAKG